MNKSLVLILGIIAAVIVGYLVLQGGAPAASDAMPDSAAGDTMPAGEVPKDDDSMVGGDAAIDGGTELPIDDADTNEGTDESMKESENSDPTTEKEEADEPVQTSAQYQAYSDGVIGNGEPAVLFFHAAWCPSCRTGDKELAALYSSGDATLNTYKVDYDNSDELKAKYGVTYQHTFILIDGNGNAIKTVQGATGAKLKELVNS